MNEVFKETIGEFLWHFTKGIKDFNSIFKKKKKDWDVYDKPMNKTTTSGVTIDETLLGKVLVEKYKNKNLPK